MGRKRRRNKSSPNQTNGSKKLCINDLETDLIDSESEFFEAQEFSDFDSPPTTPTISPSTSMTDKLSDTDIQALCAKLAPLLIRELKAELKKEVSEELKREIKQELLHEHQSELQTLKTEITSLKSKLSEAQELIKQSRNDHDELEQYGRRMNLDVTGIPGDTGATEENVEQKILDLARKCNVDISSQDIDRCHRKGKYKQQNRRVIIKFTNSRARRRFYEARKRLGQGIYVQDNLTPFREKLSYEARQLKRNKLIVNCWVSGCRVFAQLPGEGRARIIQDLDDIENIKNSRYAAQ